MSDDQFERALRFIEDDFHLAPGFLISLWAEEDAWSFVIKAHALLETALSQLLAGYLLDGRLSSAVHHLPMNGKASKVSFLKATGLLTTEEASFISEFSHLRNTLVHNVHNTRFDFQTFMVESPKHARQLASAAAVFGESENVRRKLRDNFVNHPQHQIWLMTVVLVAKGARALLRTDDERKKLATRLRDLYDLLQE